MHAMRFRRVPFQLMLVLGLGCENPQPALLGVQPAQGYSDGDLRLVLLGRELVPATILDPSSGRRIATSDGFSARLGTGGAWEDLAGIDWLSSGALAATLTAASAARLPTGPLSLEVRDPRGRVATLAGAFLELGPDVTPPTVAFLAPDPTTPFVAGMVLQGTFHAVEAAPGALGSMVWTAYENGVQRNGAPCAIPPASPEATCGFQFAISLGLGQGDVVRVVAEASDRSPRQNRATATLSITLREAPGLVGVVPNSGGTAGGTDVLVQGYGFLSGTQVFVDGELLAPNGGVLVDSTTISGHVPAHRVGNALVTARTPVGDALGSQPFNYLPPPSITAISPAIGLPAGGTAVTVTGSGFTSDTRIYFGSDLDSAAPLAEAFLQGSTSIIGRAPAGSGTAAVWAFDNLLGFSKLPSGFTWEAP
jgi:hypothetical protein